MTSTWFYTLASVLLVSVISLIGVITISLKEEKLGKILIYLVSFATGGLLGDVFIHLLPKATETQGFSLRLSLYVLSGIVIFFIAEKIIRWRHCHELPCEEHQHPFSIMILLGDGVHNFIDGLIIGASYLVSLPLGLATTLAVIFHEIPQEIGDFSALLYGGFKKRKALLFNFLSALMAVLGGFIILILGSYFTKPVSFLIPFAAGGFIYIAGSDLIPELHKVAKIKKSILQLIFLIVGILVMLSLVLLE